MFNYEVTYNQFGQVITRWFDDAKQAKRQAKFIAKMGYQPSVTRYSASDYSQTKQVWEVSLATYRFMVGHS
jgi:hypothetical protein